MAGSKAIWRLPVMPRLRLRRKPAHYSEAEARCAAVAFRLSHVLLLRAAPARPERQGWRGFRRVPWGLFDGVAQLGNEMRREAPLAAPVAVFHVDEADDRKRDGAEEVHEQVGHGIVQADVEVSVRNGDHLA